MQKLNRRQFLRGQTSAQAPSTATRRTDLNSEQEASRFLAQATLGADRELIQQVTERGIEAWIDAQFALPQSGILAYLRQNLFDESQIPEMVPRRELFRFAMWNAIVKGRDLLRQRVALALSEIFVISTEVDEIYDAANGVANWYDMLLRNAFGNFRDLLEEVTYSPIMGHYLSHASNRKTSLVDNRFPDENYAREIMQLFTIGLFLLNEDGSLLLDGKNQPIPTYDNRHITEFAKVFTGLTYDIADDPHIDWAASFGDGRLNAHTATRPMVMWDEEHEPGPKTLLQGYTLPAGQSGALDIAAALDHLFEHPNVAPFIGRRLIQRLVKSNPSPAYIARVTAAFNDNGAGVRGDMQAVVKAILLDEEARDPIYLSDPQNGKLREPFMRFTQLVRAFHFSNPQDKFWDEGGGVEPELGQYMFNAPSVFNFFSPDYRPPGPIGDAGLTAPEFQLLNSYTAISTINYWYSALEWEYLISPPAPGVTFRGQSYDIQQPLPDLSYELTLLSDIDALLDHLDLLLTYGTLSTAMRRIIRTALEGAAADAGNTQEEQLSIVRFAIYLFMICPEYAIQI